MTQVAVAIRRGKEIGDLVRDYSGAPDEEKPVKTVGENPFSALLNKYETFLGQAKEYKKVGYQHERVKNFIHEASDITDVLTPNEINQFLQMTILYENHDDYRAVTGIFITRLIQNSYNAGHNDFHIDTKELKEFDWLGAYLKGQKKRKIKISINEDVGNECGSCAQNSTFTITGNVGNYCGLRANNSIYTITGDVRGSCGLEAQNSTYTITGDVGGACGSRAENSTYTIMGDVGDRCGSEANNSTFKTPNKKTLNILRTKISIYDNNRIIFINKDGTEEVIR